MMERNFAYLSAISRTEPAEAKRLELLAKSPIQVGGLHAVNPAYFASQGNIMKKWVWKWRSLGWNWPSDK